MDSKTIADMIEEKLKASATALLHQSIHDTFDKLYHSLTLKYENKIKEIEIVRKELQEHQNIKLHIDNIYEKIAKIEQFIGMQLRATLRWNKEYNGRKTNRRTRKT